MARKLKIMEKEKHPLDDLKNDEITNKREKCEMHTEGPGAGFMLSPALIRAKSAKNIATKFLKNTF